METHKEFAESQIRRLLTVLFITRAKRHLKTLAELYEWTPEMLAAYEAQFIKLGEFVPVWRPSSIQK
jgi:hypothetical protein